MRRPLLSMKTALALQIALVFAGLMWGVSWLVERRLLADTEAMVIEQQAALANHMGRQIDEALMLRERMLGLAAASFSGEVGMDEPTAVHAYLQGQRGLLGAFDSVAVLGADRRFRSALPAGSIGAELAGLPVVEASLRQQRALMGQPVPGGPRHDGILVFTAPLFDRHGDPAGLLLGTIRLMDEDMLGWLPKSRVGRSGYFSVVNRERWILVHGDVSRVMTRASPPGVNPIIDRGLQGQQGGARGLNSRGVDSIYGFARLERRDWGVYVVLPAEEAFAPVRGYIHDLRWLTASVALLCALLTWYLLALRLKRATRLRRAMESSQGAPESYQPLPPQGRDEIARLTEAYNGAMLAIQQHLAAFHEAEARLLRLNRLYHLLSRINHLIVRDREVATLFGAVCSAFVESGLFTLALTVPAGDREDEGASALAGAAAIGSEAALLAVRPFTRRVLESGLPRFAVSPGDAHASPWGNVGPELRSAAALPLRQRGKVFAALCLFSTNERFFDEEIQALLTALVEDLSFALDFIAESRSRAQAEAERQRMNAQLEQRVVQRTSELELANTELEAFSYTVSHDLRAPLRAIRGFTSILEETQQAQLDEEAKAALDKVLACSDRMAAMIDDLLQLAQLSRYQLQRRAVDMAAMAREILRRLAQADAGHSVEVHLPDSLMVEADPRMLRHILEHLLDNAWKFSAGRPGARIELSVREEGGQRVYTVEDNGVGFDMREADHLFEPFHRLHGGQPFPGNGIGLATVKRLIGRHGGTIRADSEPGRGARFMFTLDAAA